MRSLFFVLGCFLGLASAFAEPADTWEGEYTNPAYNGPEAYQKAWVRIYKTAEGEMEMEFNVPCNTKLTPSVFKFRNASNLREGVELIERGGSQCYTGQNPIVRVHGNQVQIITQPRIETPGFDGVYRLNR